MTSHDLELKVLTGNAAKVDGIKQAMKDDRAGILGFYRRSYEKPGVIDSLLRFHYGFLIRPEPLPQAKFVDSYNRYMTLRAEEKYGPRFIARLKACADSLERVNGDWPYIAYPGGDGAMDNYFNKEICKLYKDHTKQFERLKEDHPSVHDLMLKVRMDTSGRVSVVPGKHRENRVLEVIDSLLFYGPRCIPPREHGKFLPASFYIYFNVFNNKDKQNSTCFSTVTIDGIGMTDTMHYRKKKALSVPIVFPEALVVKPVTPDSMKMLALYSDPYCIDGIRQAQEDERAGKLGWWTRSVNDMLSQLLKEEYGFVIHSGYSKTPERMSCYNAYMEQRIEEKHGKEFMLKTRLKADSVREVKMPDGNAAYPGGDKKLEKDLSGALHKKKFRKSQLHREAWAYPECDTCSVRIIPVKVMHYLVHIDSLGNVSGISPPIAYMDKRRDVLLPVIEAVVKAAAWKPAVKNGVPVSSGVVIEIDIADLRKNSRHGPGCKCVRVIVSSS